MRLIPSKLQNLSACHYLLILMVFVLLPMICIVCFDQGSRFGVAVYLAGSPGQREEYGLNGQKFIDRWWPGSRYSDLKLEVGRTCREGRVACIRTLILHGNYNPGDGAWFKQAFAEARAADASKGIDTICLSGFGGVNNEAGIIAREIKKSGYRTCVGDMSFPDSLVTNKDSRITTICMSACTVVLLASSRRLAVGDRFFLGLHASRLAGDVEKDTVQSTDQSGSASMRTGYMAPKTRRAARGSYDGALSISDDEFELIINAADLTPGGGVYAASVQEQDRLGFFNNRLMHCTMSTAGFCTAFN